MKILVVEDDSNRLMFFKQELIGHNLSIATDYNQAIEILQTNQFDIIYLDHDLKDEHYINMNVLQEGTGYEVAQWMIRNNLNNIDAFIIIHSLNPVGSENMYKALRSKGYNVKKRNFLQLKRMAKG